MVRGLVNIHITELQVTATDVENEILVRKKSSNFQYRIYSC